MIVISLSNCPPSLRGDLTKWLFEISTNVFVGSTSTRVRDEIWGRVVTSCKNGRAVMVFGATNEQRFDFRVHNGEWEPADLDGLKIMRRPPRENQMFIESKFGYSKASKYRKGKFFSQVQKEGSDETFAFVVVRTTELDSNTDRLFSIGSIAVKEGHVIDTFLWDYQSDAEDGEYDGQRRFAIEGLFDFIINKTVVFEDVNRSLKLIEAECNHHGIEMYICKKISLRTLGKKQLYNLKKHDLKSL